MCGYERLFQALGLTLALLNNVYSNTLVNMNTISLVNVDTIGLVNMNSTSKQMNGS